MSSMQRSLAIGISFTALMFAAAATLFGISDHLNMPLVSPLFYSMAVIAVITLLPGSPLGLLALNMHSAGFLILSAIGDVAIYSFVAYRVFFRRAGRSDERAKSRD